MPPMERIIEAIEAEIPGDGQADRRVREQFPVEVTAYRRRSARAETKLIAVIDADNFTLPERLTQLDQSSGRTVSSSFAWMLSR